MGAVTATILSDGEVIDAAWSVISLETFKEVNRIPAAQLTLVDGDVALGNFLVSNSAVFEPGKEIEIKLRYEGEVDTTIFTGLVVKQGVQSSPRGSVLTVEARDAAISLTTPRRSVLFKELSDSDILSRLIDESGLTAGDIDTTTSTHAEIIQYNVSNWDFMLSRADICGLYAFVDDGTVSIRTIDLSGTADKRFEYGLDDLYDFEFEIDAMHQQSGFESVAWDIEAQSITSANTSKDFTSVQGNLDGSNLAESLGFDNYVLSHPVSLDPDELQNWADARLLRNRLSMIRGRMLIRGDATIKPFMLIEMAGIGERYNGKTFVSGVRHSVDDQGWQTDVQFGLDHEWFSRKPDIQDVSSSGLLPPATNLQIGIIDSYEDDPDGQFRVRVLLPLLGEDDNVVWARLSSPDAGQERGCFFRPETGDEVIVGFFNADPRQAVILGAMYSTTNNPPEEFAALSEDNFNKGIVTKTGIKISFDDDKASLTIETPNSNKILLNDDEELIEIADQHSNTITMNSDGIEIKSAGDLKIEASGNVEIEGQKVDVK